MMFVQSLLLLLSIWNVLVFPIFSQAFVLEGSQTSYAQFRKWYASPNASLQFEFLTSQPNGLLLYTDDGGYYDFLEVKLVEGRLRLRLNLGDGAQIVDMGDDLHKGFTWHKVFIQRNQTKTKINLDDHTQVVLPDESQFRPQKMISSASASGLKQNNGLQFGRNFSANSFVYIGGLPSFYSTKLSSLALPSAVFEPRFRGSIRNIVYADDDTGRPRRQEVMAYKGVRASTVDACQHHDPCQNGGICISTDGGPICECSYIDFDGVYCGQSKEPPEVTFTGSEFLTYDLVQLGGEPILSTRDEISMYFRTNRDDGLLFYTGDQNDYLSLAIKDGGVSLSINLGNGRLDTGIRNRVIRFDDDVWHNVVITRVAQKVTMTVDGTYTEKWTTSGTFSMLSSNKVFIGGSSQPYKLPGANSKANFVGCMKKVEMKADSLYLPLLKLAKQGNRLMSSSGFISYSCRPIEPIKPVAFTSDDSHVANYFMMQQGGVVSITKPSSYLVLPSWNNTLGGSLSYKFRTNEETGLLLFNPGMAPGSGDFFAMELLDGYIYLHLNLGSGSLKLRGSNRRLDDGAWHKVDITRNRKSGSLQVDAERTSFATPGEAETLELMSPLFIGGLDANIESLFLPPVLWSAGFRQGFVGCLRDLVINGRSVNVAEYAKDQDSGSIRSSCHIMPPKCSEKPCMHGGKCIEGWNRFICDCSSTSFTGPTCGRAAATIQFDGSQHVTFTHPGNGVSEAELLNFRFRTAQKQGILFSSRDDTSADRLQIYLDNGKLYAQLNIGLTEKTIVVGEGLGDDMWHSVKLERRAMVITFSVDDERPLIAELMGSETFLDYTRLHIGAVFPRDVLVPRVANFKGYISQLTFNGLDYFDRMRTGLLTKDFEMTASFSQVDDVIFHDVTFKNQMTYLGLPQLRAYYDISISFRFKTLEMGGLIMYNAGKHQDFVAIELVNGHIVYVFNLGYGSISIKDNCPYNLNDNQWHTVTVGRPSNYKHTLLVDTNLSTANSRGDNLHLDLDGILFLGGVRTSMYENLPPQIFSKHGYQGCLANLDVGGETGNPLKNALVPSEHVLEGCGAQIQEGNPKKSSKNPKFGSKNPNTKTRTRHHCTEESCFNHGVCIEQWTHSVCNCDRTSFTGPKCAQESVAYHWGPKTGLILYHFYEISQPNTKFDILSMGFITPLDDAVLLRIDSQSSNDYFELEIVGGRLFASFNLGMADIKITDKAVKVNDGAYHVLRFTRNGANTTLQIDDYPRKQIIPEGRQLLVFNEQKTIQIGGKWNPVLRRIERPFIGVMAGMVFNGLRPLDLAADNSHQTKIQGDVHILEQIPFNYRERHPRLFEYGKYTNNNNIQRTGPSAGIPEPGVNDELIVMNRAKCDSDDERYYDPQCFSFEGSGDELITPRYNPPPRPPQWKDDSSDEDTNICDDDEECGDFGSGVYFEVTTSPPYYATQPPTTPTREEVPFWEDYDNQQIIVHHAPPTQKPFPTLVTNRPQVIYENFDTKYNVYDSEPEPKAPEEGGTGNHPITKAGQPVMVLVIGICAGALIAMVLIVIIVFKFRTRVENNYKVEETSRTYQFAASGGPGALTAPPVPTTAPIIGPPSTAGPPTLTPSVDGDTEFETPSIVGISNIPGTKATVTPAGNGFYEKYVNNNKKNNSSKVREWYV